MNTKEKSRRCMGKLLCKWCEYIGESSASLTQHIDEIHFDSKLSILASLGTQVSYGVKFDNDNDGRVEGDVSQTQEQSSASATESEQTATEESTFEGIEEELNFQERIEMDDTIKSTTPNQEVCKVAASNNAKTNRHEEVGQMEHTGNPAIEEQRGASKDNASDLKCSKCNLEFTTAKALENHRTIDREFCSFAASKSSKPMK